MRQRLAHVVNSQRRNGGAGQRFHFDTGFVRDAHMAIDNGRIILQFNRYFAALKPERMTEWDQLVGTFCGHGARDNRGLENGPFGGVNIVTLYGLPDFSGQQHAGTGMGKAQGNGLVGYIDHGRAIFIIYMRKHGGIASYRY
jgi:hypothetical protein